MIGRFLDLSTGHISHDTRAWRDAQLADAALRAVHNNRAEMIAATMTRYGWFSYAPD